MRYIKIYSLLFLFLGISVQLKGQSLNEMLFELNTVNETAKKTRLLTQIAGFYQQSGAHGKAAEYYEKALALNQADMQETLLGKTANAYFQANDYAKAIEYQEKLIEKNTSSAALLRLTTMLKANGNYTKALAISQKLVANYTQAKDSLNLAFVHNNIGFLYRQLKEYEASVSAFEEAQSLYMKVAASRIGEEKSKILTNAGATFTANGQYEQAALLYQEAFRIAESQDLLVEKGNIHNFLAINDYLDKHNENAIEQALDAAEIGEELKNLSISATAYRILSNIHQEDGNFKLSQEYYKKYTTAQQAFLEEERQKQQKQLAQQLAIEREESSAKAEISDRQKAELELKQTKLEREKQAQQLALQESEIALLKRNQDLQKSQLQNQLLEKQRIANMLELLKKQQETEKLSQEAERQQLIADRQQHEIEKQNQELEVAKKTQEMQAFEIEKEKEVLKYGIGLIILISFVLILSVYSIYQKRRDNRKLLVQADEIKNKNEELQASEEEIRQNMEELEATQELLKVQNNEMTKRNRDITASITYAKRIQTATLPDLAEFAKFSSDFFVFFCPRDIVSGDFYWAAEKDGKHIVVCADCTGHGVPGAFMSMIASNLLNEIVLGFGITEPDKILNELHIRVNKNLRQNSTDVRDGLDVAICTFLPKKDGQAAQMLYAGAMNPIFYVQDDQLFEIKADRMPIGGREMHESQQRNFTLHQIIIDKPTAVYLSTDGFQDQFGGKDDKKFLSKNFKNLLLQISPKPMAAQEVILTQAFTDWKGKRKQLDDVLIIGLKIS